ncbi:CaiB/BaiF CoA-transferase family protein [soil metagenome]
MSLPLEGVKVLELTHAVLGPTAGVILADLGAEVIKIEPTPKGDPTRYLKGFGMGFFPYLNRNKQSLAVNLKTDEGKEIVHKLLEDTDVLLENYGPGTIERLGFGYDTLKQQYPKLIFCSLKGFLPGPYENRIALDEVVQMMSGLAYMTGPPGRPLRAGASVIDVMTGMYGAMGVILALKERDKTGKGQFVKTALFETAAFLMGQHMAYHAASGEELPPFPARVSAWAIYHQFETADDKIIFIGVTSDKQWKRFCEVFERSDLSGDERLASNNSRITAQDWLLPDLREMISKLTLTEAVRHCEEARLPFSPVAQPEDLFDDAQLNEGDSLYETTFPDGIETKLPKLPLLLGDYEWVLRNDPPQVSEHSGAILQRLGYTAEEIDALAEEGIIVKGNANE